MKLHIKLVLCCRSAWWLAAWELTFRRTKYTKARMFFFANLMNAVQLSCENLISKSLFIEYTHALLLLHEMYCILYERMCYILFYKLLDISFWLKVISDAWLWWICVYIQCTFVGTEGNKRKRASSIYFIIFHHKHRWDTMNSEWRREKQQINSNKCEFVNSIFQEKQIAISDFPFRTIFMVNCSSTRLCVCVSAFREHF